MPKQHGGFRVHRHNGRDWWVGWSASAYLARDGFMLATDALKRDVERTRGGSRGPLLLGHVDGLRVGECLFGHVAGRILVEAGVFDDTPLGRAAVEGLRDYGDPLTLSIRWDGEREIITYTDVEIIERSIIPAGMEADVTTQFYMRNNPMSNWLKQFAKTLGLPADEVEQAIEDAERASELLDGAGAPSRATDEPPDEGSEDAPETEEAPDALTPDLLAEMLAAVQESIVAAVTAAVSGEIVATDQETARAIVAVGERLDTLERAVQENAAPRNGRDFLLAALANRASGSDDTEVESDDPRRDGAVGTPAHPFANVRG